VTKTLPGLRITFPQGKNLPNSAGATREVTTFPAVAGTLHSCSLTALSRVAAWTQVLPSCGRLAPLHVLRKFHGQRPSTASFL
jgi:hypothetical protein